MSSADDQLKRLGKLRDLGNRPRNGNDSSYVQFMAIHRSAFGRGVELASESVPMCDDRLTGTARRMVHFGVDLYG